MKGTYFKGDATHACADYYLRMPNIEDFMNLEEGQTISLDCPK